MVLLDYAFTTRHSSAAGFNIIHVGTDKLPFSVLEMAPLTSQVWKKSTSFDSLTHAMRDQVSTQWVPKSVSVVDDEITINTTTVYVESTETI